MTTVQLPPLAQPGRGAQGGARESLGSSAGGRSATAFGTLFHGHLTQRNDAPGARADQQSSANGATPAGMSGIGARNGASAAGGSSALSGLSASGPVDAAPAASQLAGADVSAQSAAPALGDALQDGRMPVQGDSVLNTTPEQDASGASLPAGGTGTAGTGTAGIGTAGTGTAGTGTSGVPASESSAPDAATPAAPAVDPAALASNAGPIPHASVPDISGDEGLDADGGTTPAARAGAGTGDAVLGTAGSAEDAASVRAGADPASAEGQAGTVDADDARGSLDATGQYDSAAPSDLPPNEAGARSEDQRHRTGAQQEQAQASGQAAAGSSATAGSGAGTSAPTPQPPVPGVPVAVPPTAGAAAGASSGTPSDTVATGVSAPSAGLPRTAQEQGPAAGLDIAARTTAPEHEAVAPRTDPVAVPQQAAPAAPVGAAAPATAATPAHPVRPPAPLPQQLGAQAFALVQSAAETDGRMSTITVAVAPDDLGPITIRASLSAEGTRLEFFSATDGGREALRQAMPELRREAASSGLSAALDLGAGTPDDSARERLRDEFRSSRDGRLPDGSPPVPGPPTPWAGRNTTGSSTLDLFA